MTKSIYNSILVTGGCGFIGSHFIEYFSEYYQDTKIINIDKLGYAVSNKTVELLNQINNYSFYKVDITDIKDVKKIFSENNFDAIFHFAAESHVDNSITSPSDFVNSNIMGTYNLLECTRHSKDLGKNIFFHHISTDEVYGSLSKSENPFEEDNKYLPSSPYSASKASSDLLVEAWSRTYNLDYLITNCSNNYGSRQNIEKLIPKIIKNAVIGKEIPIYGTGDNIRDWLFVKDHVDGILKLHTAKKKNTTYNIGGGFEISNIDLTHMILSILEEDYNFLDLKKLIRFVEDRKGHDFRYAINSSKIFDEAGWQPSNSFQHNLNQTIEWYIKNQSWWDE